MREPAYTRRMGNRRVSLLAAVGALVVLALPGVAPAALPRQGVLVRGERLGGIAIGMTKTQVRARWGSQHGRCRSCAYEVWYYTYRPFEPQGAAVEFDAGRRVRRVFTLYEPEGWRSSDGLDLGAPEADVASRYGSLPRRQCTGYTALILKGLHAWTEVYVYEGRVWGFGLSRPDASPCV